MIKGFIITVANDDGIDAAYRCFDSIDDTQSLITPEIYPATTPETLDFDMPFSNYIDESTWPGWNWPKTPQEDKLDFKTGIFKSYYPAKHQNKVIACAVSHARLWQKCIDLKEDIMVLESDALFISKFDYSEWEDKGFGVLGLNDPRGATRLSQVFYNLVTSKEKQDVYQVPLVDDTAKAHGLAGNSAYIIRPYAAKQLLIGMNDYGLWPNDAYMCQELWPWLRVTQPFYTKVQGLPSTTTR